MTTAHSCFRAFFVGCSLFVTTLATAAETDSAKNGAESLQMSIDKEQRLLASQFSTLQEMFIKLADMEGDSNPARANLLRQAAQLSKQLATQQRLSGAADYLAKGQFTRALQEQDAARESLQKLLELLQRDNRSQQLKDERERVEQALKEVQRIARLQKSLRGRTESGQELKESKAEQESLKSQTSEVDKSLKEVTDPKSTKESDTAESKDASKQSKEADKQSDSGKQSESKDDSQSNPSDSSKPDGSKPQSSDKQGEQKTDDQNKSKSDEPKNDQPKPDQSDDDQQKDDSTKPNDQDPSKKNSDESSNGQESQNKSPDNSSQDSQQSKNAQQSQHGQPPQQGEQGQQSKDNEPKSPEQKAQQRVQRAQQRMQQALEKMEKAEREDAVEEQREAEAELAAAVEELENILRQMREEEIERSLANLESRFRKMLTMQTDILKQTERYASVDGGLDARQIELQSVKLSLEENKVLLEGRKAMLLLEEEGSSMAFPEAVEQLNSDIALIVDLFNKNRMDQSNVQLQQQVVATLEELLDSVTAVQKDKEKKKEQEKAQKGGGQQPQEQIQQLVDKLAELRLIRTLQMRINKRTVWLSQQNGSQDDPLGQLADPVLSQQTRDLADRQNRLESVLRDIILQENQKN